MKISSMWLICALLSINPGATDSLIFRSGFGEWYGFAASVAYPAQGTDLEDAAFADIDSDGIRDMALIDGDSRKLVFFKGSKAGSFSLLGEMETFSDPRQIIFAHINDDAHVDMMVRGYFANGFSTYSGIGNGAFENPVFYGLSGHATTMVAADLNNDGLVDAAVTRSGSGQPIKLSIYFNDGSGSLELQQELSTAYDTAARMLACDINNDPWPDLIMSSPSPAPVVIALSGENAVYAAPFHLDPMYWPWDGSMYFSCLDIDGDDDIDLLVTRPFREPATLSLYRNIAGTGFGAAEEISTPNYHATDVSSAHIDNDGSADLVFSAFPTTAVMVLRGGGKTAVTVDAPTSVRRFVVGPIDGDEFDDMVMLHTDGSFSVRINRGAD